MRILLTVTAVACLVVAPPSRADEQADVQKVIEKAIKAHGENVGKHKAAAFKMKGKFYGAGEQAADFTAEFKVQEPSQSRMDINLDIAGSSIEGIQTLNGDKGWKSVGGNVEDMNKDEYEEAKEGLYADRVSRLLPLKEKGFKLSSLGEKKVGDRVAVGVKIAHEGHREINLYFDKEKGLLLLTERRIKDAMTNQEYKQDSLYEDYKPVDGVQQAHKLTITRDDKKFVEGEISEFKRLD